MRTIKEILADIERGESAVALSVTALKLLDLPGVPHWLVEKVLVDSMHTNFTVKQIDALVKPHLISLKEFKRKIAAQPVKVGKCTIENCTRKHFKNGWCKQHWNQMQADGFIRPIWQNNHRKLAERALGKSLPKGAQVHHLDVDPKHNHPANLVVCPDAAYHMLIERRGRAYKACGHADWLKCIYCKQYDDRKKLKIPRSKKNKNVLRETWAYHPKCMERNSAKYKK